MKEKCEICEDEHWITLVSRKDPSHEIDAACFKCNADGQKEWIGYAKKEPQTKAEEL